MRIQVPVDDFIATKWTEEICYINRETPVLFKKPSLKKNNKHDKAYSTFIVSPEVVITWTMKI